MTIGENNIDSSMPSQLDRTPDPLGVWDELWDTPTNNGSSPTHQTVEEPNPFIDPIPGSSYRRPDDSAPPTARIREYANLAAAPGAKARRRDELRTAARKFYERHQALAPENVAAVRNAEVMYTDILTGREEAAKHLRKAALPREAAAILFAAASLLRQKPDRLTLDKRAPEILSQNRQRAWEYLAGNLQLLMTPDGIWNFSDRSLHPYAGMRRDELAGSDFAHPGLEHVPTVLAVLAADMIHSDKSAILRIPNLDRKLEAQGALLDNELLRLEAVRPSLRRARETNLTNKEREALREHYKRAEIEKASRMRDIAERVVEGAARIRYGNNESSTRLLHVLAECLVADAHDFFNPGMPAHIKDVLAMRMADADHRDKPRSVNELPAGARHYYKQCMEHARKIGYDPRNRIAAWLGIGAIEGSAVELDNS